MKILLIGEYSRLHNSLKEGLTTFGHEVKLVGRSDGFKNYPVDIEIKKKYDSGWLKKTRVLLLKLTGVDLHSISVKRQIKNLRNQISNYDIVQFINEAPFHCRPKTEKAIFQFIKQHNKNVFLLSCGFDYLSIKYAHNKNYRYSILTPLHEDKKLEPQFKFILKRLASSYLDLHQYIFESITGVIASDIDYHVPLKNHPKYLGLIPNPINTDKIQYIPLQIKDKIKIFHGINKESAVRKGNQFFTEALKIIDAKYGNRVEIITTSSIPYNEYIKLYDDCHILLDMVYAYDQGYNALEAMAKGKVVFTGAEQEFLDHYELAPDTVVINALPNVDYLVEKLSWLIENPDKITVISKNARNFIKREHHYIKIAEKYLAKKKRKN